MDVSNRKPRKPSPSQQTGAVSGKRTTGTLTQAGKTASDEESPVCDKYEALYKGLTEIKEHVMQSKLKATGNLAGIETNRKTVQRDIDDFKNELYQFVDILVDGMYKEVKDIVDTDKNTIDKVTREYDTVAAQVQGMITELNVKKESKGKVQLFLAIDRAQNVAEQIKNKLPELDAQNKIRSHIFEREKQLHDTMRSIQRLGQLSINGNAYVKSATANRSAMQRPNKEPQDTVASGWANQRRKNVPESTVVSTTDHLVTNCQDDKTNSAITSMQVMDNNYIALVDSKNESVKMFSLRRNTVTHQLELVTTPWDITKVNNHTMAVTCPDEQYIQLVSLSEPGKLSLERKIKTEGECRGIHYINARHGQIIVSLRNPSRVKIIDMHDGTVVKDLSFDLAETALFGDPLYVTMNSDSSIVYVSDSSKDTVTAMTVDAMDSVVKFIYRDDQLHNPQGIAVGDDGVIYVCGSNSHNIHMVSSAGRKIKVLLGEKDGLRSPQCIMYTSTDPKLYMGMWDNDNVRVATFAQ